MPCWAAAGAHPLPRASLPPTLACCSYGNESLFVLLRLYQYVYERMAAARSCALQVRSGRPGWGAGAAGTPPSRGSSCLVAGAAHLRQTQPALCLAAPAASLHPTPHCPIPFPTPQPAPNPSRRRATCLSPRWAVTRSRCLTGLTPPAPCTARCGPRQLQCSSAHQLLGTVQEIRSAVPCGCRRLPRACCAGNLDTLCRDAVPPHPLSLHPSTHLPTHPFSHPLLPVPGAGHLAD